MNIKWKKKGIIYKQMECEIFKSHTTRPIPYKIDENILRIFFTSRDAQDRSQANFIDVDINNPQNILHQNRKCLIQLGRAGLFDDSGITPACIISAYNRCLMYYTGWRRRRINTTFDLSIGALELSEGFPLKKIFKGPIISQNKDHPYLAGGPYVVFDDEKLKMWYCSGYDWFVDKDIIEPLYDIHYAESTNGIDWKPMGVVVPYSFYGEVLSAPWVIKVEQQYHMWYSKRGSKDKTSKRYTIGYANLRDGANWTRHDNQVTLECSAEGWDSEMICYPALFSHKNKTYMFYSGNEVGKGGLGYAEASRFF